MRQFSTPAMLAYGISGCAAAASFLATFILARATGATVLGHYALAASTASMLATLALCGLDWITLREIAGDLRQGDKGRARATLIRITKAVGLSTALVAAVYLFVNFAAPITSFLGGDKYAMLAVTLGIVAWPFLRLGYSGLRATGKPIYGQLFESMPTFLFAGCISILALMSHTPNAGQVTTVFFGMQIVAALGAWAMLMPKISIWNVPSINPSSANLRAGLTMMATAFLQIFSEWLLLAGLSATASAAEAGAFRVAFQILTIPALIAATTESYVAPKFAGDFRSGQPQRAKLRHKRATILMLFLAAPILLAVFVYPARILELVFGREFVVAATSISIMAIGQTFNIIRGPIGSALLMSGNEGFQLKITIAGLIILLVLASLLIPKYGLIGAAISYSAPLVFRSIAGYWAAHRIFKSGQKI